MKKILTIALSFLLVISALSGCTAKKKAEPTKSPVAVNQVFDEGKTYDEGATYDTGSITTSDVVLKNAIFNGDLVIEKSVGEGDVTLDGITVKGKLIVKGGGSNSVVIDNSNLGTIESDKKDSSVRIVISINSAVDNVNLSGDTKLEVSGQVTNLTVNSSAKNTDVLVQPDAKVSKIEVNAPSTLMIQSPVGDLNLKAESNVQLEANVANIRVEALAQNTQLTLSKDVTVQNFATETKVDVSGKGSVTNVITSDQKNITGNVKAENVVVSTDPIAESKKEIIATTPTPQATVAPRPTVTPKPTVAPTAIPTVAPTVAPTPVPTAKPVSKYTVTFVINSDNAVNPQTVNSGTKITAPTVTLVNALEGSIMTWHNQNGSLFNFDMPITENKTITGKINYEANNVEDLVEALSEGNGTSVINLSANITSTTGFSVLKDIEIKAKERKTITVTTGNVFTLKKSVSFAIDNVILDGTASDSRAINVMEDVDVKISVNNSELKVKDRGISFNGVSAAIPTYNPKAEISIVNSKILNTQISDDKYQTEAVMHSDVRGISLYDTVGTLDIQGSQIFGFKYAINVSGTAVADKIVDLSGLSVSIDSSAINGYTALNIWGSYSTYTISKNSMLKGINTNKGSADSFATIVFNEDKSKRCVDNKLTIKDSTITNYVSPEAQTAGVKEQLIRVDSGIEKLVFEGVVNLTDTTGKLDSGIYFGAMFRENPEDYIANRIKINGTVNSTSNSKDMPLYPTDVSIMGAKIEYQAGAENIIVSFELNKSITLEVPTVLDLTDLEELTALYGLVLQGTGEEKAEAAKKIGNDVILNYYYVDSNGKPVSLLTTGRNPLVKNKLWSGYLSWKEGDVWVILPEMSGTSLNSTVPSNKTLLTSTNPRTLTVSEGWLDVAKGHKVYVSIVVIYNGKVYESTVSVDIPADAIPSSNSIIEEVADDIIVEELFKENESSTDLPGAVLPKDEPGIDTPKEELEPTTEEKSNSETSSEEVEAKEEIKESTDTALITENID